MEGPARLFVPVPSWHWQATFSALEKGECADLFRPCALNRGCYVTLRLRGWPEHAPRITPQQAAAQGRPLNLPRLFLKLLAQVSGGVAGHGLLAEAPGMADAKHRAGVCRSQGPP